MGWTLPTWPKANGRFVGKGNKTDEGFQALCLQKDDLLGLPEGSWLLKEFDFKDQAPCFVPLQVVYSHAHLL